MAYGVVQKSYDSAMGNREELTVGGQARVPYLQVLSKAQISNRPVSPRKFLDLAAALVLGVLLGLVGAVAKERRPTFEKTLLPDLTNTPPAAGSRP